MNDELKQYCLFFATSFWTLFNKDSAPCLCFHCVWVCAACSSLLVVHRLVCCYAPTKVKFLVCLTYLGNTCSWFLTLWWLSSLCFQCLFLDDIVGKYECMQSIDMCNMKPHVPTYCRCFLFGGCCGLKYLFRVLLFFTFFTAYVVHKPYDLSLNFISEMHGQCCPLWIVNIWMYLRTVAQAK